jgi:magnesium transporter
MVDNYRPEVERLEERLEKLEREVFARADGDNVKQVLVLKRDVAALRRVVVPQRDVMARLARREFGEVGEQVAYRFRDVYDHLVRLTEEAFFLQDRTTGLLEANISAISNRLNAIMKVLTVLSTIFMPLTVLTGMYGMNVTLPAFPGGDGAQFWWVFGIMVALIGGMLWVFRRLRWI